MVMPKRKEFGNMDWETKNKTGKNIFPWESPSVAAASPTGCSLTSLPLAPELGCVWVFLWKRYTAEKEPKAKVK